MTYPIKRKYVMDENGKKTAVQLDVKTFDKLLDDLHCALGYEEARKENSIDMKNGKYKTIQDIIKKRKDGTRKISKRKIIMSLLPS